MTSELHSIPYRQKRMLIFSFLLLSVLVVQFFSLSKTLNHLIQIDAYTQITPYTSCGLLCEDDEVNDYYTRPFKPSPMNYLYFVLSGLLIVYYAGDVVLYSSQLKNGVNIDDSSL